MTAIDLIRDDFGRAVQLIVERLKKELTEQGHVASGKLRDSIESEITEQTATALRAIISAEDYWRPVNYGVSAGRIPYGGRSGGGTSKYIEGLIRWAGFVKPGLSQKERKSFAFAVAAKHKKEGMPTRGSYAFSKNGRRTSFVDKAAETAEAEMEAVLNLAGYEDAVVRLMIGEQKN